MIAGALLTGAIAVNPIATAGPLDLILQSGFVVKLVLASLLLASVVSWAVIFMKNKAFRAAKKQSQAFLNTFWYGQDLEEIFSKVEQYPQSPVANVFKAGFKELKKLSQLEGKAEALRQDGLANVSRALTRATLSEISNLEIAVGILATVGSATPFVGLFGTVWGIMNSFQGIGTTGNANLAVVAPGISEALIATAAGLAAAIPAVMAYNYFVAKIKSMATEMDTFTQDFLNIVQRSLMKAQ
ncbi:MAG: protein TolQ [Bdellovibrionota bacterium]